MSPLFETFSEYPLLLLAVLLALGAAVGHVRIAGVRLGPAAVLFAERAFTVLRAIVSATPEGKNWDALWTSLGRYDPVGPAAERDKAAEQWKGWVSKS